MGSPAQLLACAYDLLGRRAVPQSLAAFKDAELAGAQQDDCAAGQWQCLMLLERFEDAWLVAEAIAARQRQAGTLPPTSLWDGEPLQGKRVMLRCLHGFGDAVEFIRYAPALTAAATSLTVECHPKIAPLLRACEGVRQVIVWGAGAPAQPPPWDTQIEIMELPYLFRTTPVTVPGAESYLQTHRLNPDPETDQWIERIEQRRAAGRLQLGLCWRSSQWEPSRSAPLKQLQQACRELANADLFSLQHEGAAELAGTSIEGLDGTLEQVALRVAALDVILTVDSVVAHIAGALGKTVLLLLPFAADWRWGLREATCWYPRTRLLRQTQPGDWSAPLALAAQTLRHLSRP